VTRETAELPNCRTAELLLEDNEIRVDDCAMTPLAKRRKESGRQQSMFLRMIWRAALVRRGRALTALLAVAVAAAVTTTLLNLYVDAQAKLRTEFRNYGANIVVVAPEGTSLPADALSKVEKVIGSRGMAVPVAYAVAKVGSTPVVVVGTDLGTAFTMNKWWSHETLGTTTSTPSVIGARALKSLDPKSEVLTLEFGNRSIRTGPVSVLKTGAVEDSRIYFELRDFTSWTGVQPSTIEIAVSGSTEEINSTMEQLKRALNPPTSKPSEGGAPGASAPIEVRPVRQIQEGEARVLGKTRGALLGSTALVIAVAALCVLATLMSWVLDRRRDFAVMKALGASEALLQRFFAAEAALIGALGSIAGFLVGIGAAAWIGRVNFHSPVVPRFGVFPEVLIGGVVVALLSAVVPISFLRGIQPAVILRGE
jgi:putative ABC transport system permease protein